MQRKAMVYVGRESEKQLNAIRKHSETVLANYGQSVLVLADDEGLKALVSEGFRVREIPDSPVLKVRAFSIDTSRKTVRSKSATAAKMALPSGRSHHLLRLVGPMHPDWKKQLEKTGVVFQEVMPEDVYLIETDSAKLDELQSLDFVESVTPYHSVLKINPMLFTEEVQAEIKAQPGLTPIRDEEPIAPTARAEAPPKFESLAEPDVTLDEKTEGNLELVLFNQTDLLTVVDAARAAGAKVIRTSEKAVIVFAPPTLVPKLAAIPQVKEVNPYAPPRLHNNVATGIIKADVLHNSHGLDGAGQIVCVADTGLDNGVNDATVLDDFQGRIVNLFALGRPGDASDLNGHGTHVAGSVLGDGANSNGNVRGMAPAASLVFQSIEDAGGSLGGIPANLGVGLFDVARDQGARIHTNSWGAPVNGAYNANATEADTFAFNNREFLILFSSGNEGQNVANKIGSPGTAKNVLTVGASENVRPLAASVNFPGGFTIPNLSEQADNQNHVAAFSSIGPAQNNRRKPDVVAPGSWILSCRSTVQVADIGPDGLPGTGDEDGVRTHNESVKLGLPGQPIRTAGDQNTPDAPPGSGPNVVQNYMYNSGTSMATPVTAGACALVRQYLIEQRGHTPSAALIKALMVNGAVDMGMGVPHTGQGWGRIDLDNTLFPPGANRVQFDDTLDNAVATGDIQTYDVFVSSSATPLAVTLVWRDPQGAAIQNKLHLRVTHVPTNVTSTSDPIGDIRNNVQKVLLNAPQTGQYTIEVEGVNVITGVPELLPALRQDYALVVSNATGYSCNPSDIVQIIDRSGSMGFSGYIEPAKERAKQMIDILQINDKAGVVTFASSATEVLALTPINSQDDKNAAHAVINPITASGSTDLREALERGLTTLGPDLGRPRAMVFLSDGHHTVATPAIDDPFLDSIAAANAKVYTIALGPDSDFTVLNNIAFRTGTTAVYSIESAADLHKLNEIYYNIIGGIGCGGLVHLNSDTLDLTNGKTQEVNIDATVQEAHFALSWQTVGDSYDFTLQDPTGALFDPLSNKVFFFEGSSHSFYRVSKPKKGLWKMINKPLRVQGNQPPILTTAALADSDIKCQAQIDTRFLFHDKLNISLKVQYGKKSLTGGRAVARITFPTLSIKDLLRKYADKLKRIRLSTDDLKKDKKADVNLIKLGVLAARLKAEGRDIFARKTVDVRLAEIEPGKNPTQDGGVYTAFFDPKRAGVAGNFQVQILFEASSSRLGTHTCTTLIPVFVPQVGIKR